MPAGALGLGQAKASFLQQIVTACSLVCQLYGAYVADARLGRYKTIVIFCIVYFIGLSVITITSLPASLRAGLGFPGWLIGALIIAFGSGGIKGELAHLHIPRISFLTRYCSKCFPSYRRSVPENRAIFTSAFDGRNRNCRSQPHDS